MTPLIINGKKVSCPSSYEELTTRTYQRIVMEWDMDEEVADRDFFKLFSILTDTDFNIVPSSENEVTIWNAISWYVTQPFQFSSTLPKALEIGEKKISVPEKAGLLSIGQNIHLRQIIDRSKYMEENISMAVAICLQPLYDESKFDITRAKELEKKILEMPVYLTHPVGFSLLQTVRPHGLKPINRSRRQKVSLGRILKRMWPLLRKYQGFKSLTTYPL